MYGPAERELRRLGRRCAAVLRVVVMAAAWGLAFLVGPSEAVLGAVGAMTLWSAGYVLLLWRSSGGWLMAVDAGAVCVACLTQQWTVPPDAIHDNSWVGAVASIAVAGWQWHGGVRAAGTATAAVIVAFLAGSDLSTASLIIVLWLAGEAALSSGLYHLVRAGAREADRMMAGAEQSRRDAAVAAARRADEREHLAAIHDTAAATFQAIGAGVVTGREPWLAKQLADALDEVAGDATTPRGPTDLVPLLDDVVRAGPVTVELSVPAAVPLPATVAVAICRATGEALRNVARHAGVDEATVRVEHRSNTVLVEIADHGVGFDPARVPAHRRGIALSLVDRMAAVGGRAHVTSSPGRGTRVRLEWPDG